MDTTGINFDSDNFDTSESDLLDREDENIDLEDEDSMDDEEAENTDLEPYLTSERDLLDEDENIELKSQADRDAEDSDYRELDNPDRDESNLWLAQTDLSESDLL